MKPIPAKARRWVLIALFVTFVLIGGFHSLPYSACGEEDPELQSLTHRAAGGDIGAIRELHQRAVRDRVQVNEEHWALEGALRGDKELREAYSELFMTRYDEERKRRVTLALRAEPPAPGTPCLLAVIEKDPQKIRTCEEHAAIPTAPSAVTAPTHVGAERQTLFARTTKCKS